MNQLARIAHELALLGGRIAVLEETLERVANNLDHLHNDLVAVRGRMRLYDPRCHDPAPDATSAPAHEEE